MLFQMGSGDTLTAVLAAAANSTNPAVKVDYRGVTGVFSDYVTLTDDAAVTLFTGPEKDNPVVTGLSVCNIDDAAITLTLKHVRGGTAYTVLVATLAVSDTLVIGMDGVHVTDSAGNLSVGGVSLLTSLADDTDLALGDSDDVLLRFSTGDSSNPAAVLALDNTSQALHVTDKAAVATDWNISGTTHPNVYIHSNTTPATDYVRIGGHDGTTGHLDVVGGTTLSLDIAGTPEVTVSASVLDLTSADLQMQASGQILDNAGNELIEFLETASAVNGLRIVNAATGNKPIITNEGEADTGIILANYDGTNTEEIVILGAVATGVNEITVTNAAAGSAPSIAATGDDTDINLTLTPKGAGLVVANGPLQVRDSVAVTATTGGGTTGLIPAGSSFVAVTSDDAAKQISLPAASVGDVIRILVGATGCELISATGADKANNVTIGATNQLALVATSFYLCEYVAANTWLVSGRTNEGVVETPLVPDAIA